ncbi:phosphotyrosine protein phosphatases I [Clavulina sp. PMI_390]|nr:phosphotyrosine protein phosphatases I [Clavulina sp. PMI_390]
MAHEAKKKGLDVFVDSAGTAAYHVGEEPDERTTATCKKHGVPIDHLARAVTTEDFDTFDWIMASDQQNLANLKRMAPADSKAKVVLFGSFDDNKPIQDPYYGGISGFETTYEQCVRYSNAFFKAVFPSASL